MKKSVAVAQVDKIPVYSNKKVKSIKGNKINFADGSWCDPTTMQYENKGSGYIISGSDISIKKETKKTKTIQKSFPAKELKIADINGSLDIQLHDKDTIEVVISGDSELIEEIEIKDFKKKVSILGKHHKREKKNFPEGIHIQDTGKNCTDYVARFGKKTTYGISHKEDVVHFSEDKMLVGGGGNENSLVNILIKVPKGTPLSVENIYDDVSIGDTEAPIHLSILSSGNTNVGIVADAQIRMGGAGKLNVKEIRGRAFNINSTGVLGETVIKKGNVDCLNAAVSNNGMLAFKGQSDYAIINVFGGGSVRTGNVANRPIKNVVYAGEIRIANWK